MRARPHTWSHHSSVGSSRRSTEERCARRYRLREAWAACGPLLDSWQVKRSPEHGRQFHGPDCLGWLRLWSRESRTWDSHKPTMESRSSWAEEIIIILVIIIIIILLIIIVGSWPHKPGVLCVFPASLPFYWLRAFILIQLRECQKIRKNHPSNEIIKVIYANQWCRQLIKAREPPLRLKKSIYSVSSNTLRKWRDANHCWLD